MFLHLTQALRNVAVDRRGAAMIEYALLLALVAVVSITALTSLGTTVRDQFAAISTSL